MEVGHYHATRGYWQTTGMPPQSVLDTYPTGTVQIPVRPSADHDWDGTDWVLQTREIEPEAVTFERDTRVAAGFSFEGKEYQSDPESLANIAGAATAAVAALQAGVAPDDVHWVDPTTPFTWLAKDNTNTQMGPQKVIDFGNAAMAHKMAHIFAARALKDQDPTPQNYKDPTNWPPHWPGT